MALDLELGMSAAFDSVIVHMEYSKKAIPHRFFNGLPKNIPPNGALHTKAVSRRGRQSLAEALRPKATGPIQGGAHRTTSLSGPLTSLGYSDDDPTVSMCDPGPVNFTRPNFRLSIRG